MGAVNQDDHHQELEESLETLSLTDFPLTNDQDSTFFQDQDSSFQEQDQDQDLFEFFNNELAHSSEENKLSHAEDMIFAGKLIPINDQPPKTTHRRRSESMRELKSTANKGSNRVLIRNSYSLDSRKLQKNSRSFNSEPKSSSSRWVEIVFGPTVKVPAEMDLRDIRNRQIVQNTSKSLFPVEGGGDGFRVGGGDNHHRKSSWGVLGILSCKSSGSVAVTMP